jgi:hypothetical protein
MTYMNMLGDGWMDSLIPLILDLSSRRTSILSAVLLQNDC